VSAAKQALYPVGSIYANYTSSTNPATLLGFGTWTAIEGRVLVGKAPSGTFATAGSTGGAETHTLSVAEMPSHTHTQNAHSHPLTPGGNILGGGGGTPAGLGGGAGWVYNIQSAASVTATNKNTGGGGAHNNLQPYVVVYMWQRTA
jgi:microcystin-dependent protein